MKKILFILLVCMSVMSSSYGQTGSNEADPFLVKMFDYAKAHNVKALEGLRNEVKLKKNRTVTNAYSLALYIAAPEKYKQQYVNNFPVDYQGIMLDFYEQIELKKLTPTFFYSIDSLGLIAAEGNDKAIEKVLIGSIHSDGIVGEEFCDILEKIFDKQLHKTVKAFSRIDDGQRQKAYSCFEMMEAKDFGALKSKLEKLKAKATKPEKKIIREIENYQ
jgi:hypothetical protein